ncbi:MAG: branched-chain amino acid ABC transporter permease [Verrucomicrobiota bacterium]|nr:branched-chain amino acid ABC transporter permease [Verrucomicrobiota bacterium]
MFERTKICLIAALAISAVVSSFSAKIDPYFYDIILTIGINVILAVSLNLVNGYTGQFSLGHAGFMAVGAYTAAAFTTYSSAGFLSAFKNLSQPLALEIFFAAALLTGGLAAALAGLLVGIPSLRLKGDYLAIVTLGFGEIIRVIIQNVDAVGGPRGFSVIGGYATLFWIYGLAAVTIYVITNLVHSTYGRGFLSVRDDEIAAEAMGINTTKYKVLAFTMAAFFAGIAGGLYAHFKQYIHPEGFNFLRSFDFVVMVILGGMGNTTGVIIAAVLLTILPEGLRSVSGFGFLPDWLREIAKNRMIIYSLLLIVLMLTRPQGLFGRTESRRKAKA